jgi:hypothetical protein
MQELLMEASARRIAPGYIARLQAVLEQEAHSWGKSRKESDHSDQAAFGA